MFRRSKNNPSSIQEVNKEVEQLGVTDQEQWATLGQYDFITIVEAPDETTMAKVSVELGSRGTMSSQTLAARSRPRSSRRRFELLREGSCVVGGGGREHAIVRALASLAAATGAALRSGQRRDRRGRCAASASAPRTSTASSARRADEEVDLVVVGPGGAAGRRTSSMRSSEDGIAAFGPSGEAARSSRARSSHAKELMEEAGVPTAAHAVVALARSRRSTQLERARRIRSVLKADGLAAGKGVIICRVRGARRARRSTSSSPERRFGDTGVVIEEFLEGEELSLLALCDGENVLPLAPAQDYKRIFDGDEGPNTGGMGSYSPVPGIDSAEAERITRRSSTARSSTAMAGRGHPYPRGPLRRA